MADVQIENHGSVFLVRPLTNAATAWLDENIDCEAQYFGGALVVEHRYIADIAEGMRADGLEVH